MSVFLDADAEVQRRLGGTWHLDEVLRLAPAHGVSPSWNVRVRDSHGRARESWGLTVSEAIDSILATITEETHSAQDRQDGAALRRLREALPAHTIQVKFDVLAYGRQCVVAAADGDDAYMALADTIAEAADACREALKGS